MRVINVSPLGAARVAAVLAALFMSLAATPAAAQGTRSFSVTFHATASGAPKVYQLQGYAADHGIPANMQLWLSRVASTGNHVEQTHEYDVANTQTACTSDLGNCHISDNSNLGSMGRISLNFKPTAHAKAHQDLCDTSPYMSLGTVTERKGTLTGTFRLNTGTGYFGSITNRPHHVHIPTVVPATVTKYVPTGNPCYAGPAGPCVASVGVVAFTSPVFADAEQYASETKGRMQLTWHQPTGNDNVTLQHSLSARVPKPGAKITSNIPMELQRLRVNFNKLAPFVTNGIATFDATEDPTFADHCHQVTRTGTVTAAMTLHFDGFGSIPWSGGDAFAFWSQAS